MLQQKQTSRATSRLLIVAVMRNFTLLHSESYPMALWSLFAKPVYTRVVSIKGGVKVVGQTSFYNKSEQPRVGGSEHV